MGSKLTPKGDKEWAFDADWIPEKRYLRTSEFEKIDFLVRNNKNLKGEFEVLVFVGLLSLLVNNFINFKPTDDKLLTQDNEINREKFNNNDSTNLIKRDKLFFGTGYDSGDTFFIREIVKHFTTIGIANSPANQPHIESYNLYLNVEHNLNSQQQPYISHFTYDIFGRRVLTMDLTLDGI